jgi:hypothetical protein
MSDRVGTARSRRGPRYPGRCGDRHVRPGAVRTFEHVSKHPRNPEPPAADSTAAARPPRSHPQGVLFPTTLRRPRRPPIRHEKRYVIHRVMGHQAEHRERAAVTSADLDGRCRWLVLGAAGIS